MKVHGAHLQHAKGSQRRAPAKDPNMLHGLKGYKGKV